MSLQIPDLPVQSNGSYYERPEDFTKALDDARSLLKELATSDAWESMPSREEVELSKIVDTEDAYAIPITRGSTLIEGISPLELMGVLLLPGMRKKWDPRLDEGHNIRRFSQSSYQLYSIMKSPSYFIWARDICAVQESYWDDDNQKLLVVQVSVKDEERLPENGSYQKSRTRATVELSAWQAEKVEEGTKVSYIVKVHLNGSIPTSIVQTLALETPMCVGRVRDTFYENGHAPVELTPQNKRGTAPYKTVSVTQKFDDADGEKRWTGEYAAAGADTFTILYDKNRMYIGGVKATATSKEGNDVSAVDVTVDDASSVVKVTVGDDLEKGKTFEIVIEPAA